MQAREVGAVGVGRHGRARLLPDPDGAAVGALHQQGLQGVRAGVAGARVRRGRQAPQEQGVAAQVPQVRDAAGRAAGALLGRRLRLRAQEARQVLTGQKFGLRKAPVHAQCVGVLLMFYTSTNFKIHPCIFKSTN